jgi:hypothetical protein
VVTFSPARAPDLAAWDCKLIEWGSRWLARRGFAVMEFVRWHAHAKLTRWWSYGTQVIMILSSLLKRRILSVFVWMRGRKVRSNKPLTISSIQMKPLFLAAIDHVVWMSNTVVLVFLRCAKAKRETRNVLVDLLSTLFFDVPHYNSWLHSSSFSYSPSQMMIRWITSVPRREKVRATQLYTGCSRAEARVVTCTCPYFPKVACEIF